MSDDFLEFGLLLGVRSRIDGGDGNNLTYPMDFSPWILRSIGKPSERCYDEESRTSILPSYG